MSLETTDASTIKLILYKDGKEAETVIEENNEQGNKRIFYKIEKWKALDIKKNTVKLVMGKDNINSE
jgi:hypothetical protein